MHWLYGTSWGVGLGLLTAGEAEPPPVVPTGLALGAGVWAASLVELPLLGLAPPVWRQSPARDRRRRRLPPRLRPRDRGRARLAAAAARLSWLTLGLEAAQAQRVGDDRDAREDHREARR